MTEQTIQDRLKEAWDMVTAEMCKDLNYGE